MSRSAHWVRKNTQCRIPKRLVAFDTESNRAKDGKLEVQTWKLGAAIRWRRDLKTGHHREDATFDTPGDLWAWVTDYCRSGVRTYVIAHNLGYDIRISDAFRILPDLGWHLDWCNLDRNVSTVVFRGEHGTLVLCDLYTWLPMSLSDIGRLCYTGKLRMPGVHEARSKWSRYCLRDAEIIYVALNELLDWIQDESLGSFQPTGAGFAYSMWRHRFLTHKVLVHDNEQVLRDERVAMHTGRAEAWRHGDIGNGPWFEVDLRSAYTRIAAESDLPTKYKFSTGRISLSMFEELTTYYRVLCVVDVDTESPVAPHNTGDRCIWPVGRFQTTLWDVEVNELIGTGAEVEFVRVHTYTSHNILGSWANYILSQKGSGDLPNSPVVGAYCKHAGRALVGRLSLKVPQWEVYGENPTEETGLAYTVDLRQGSVRREMYVGDRTLTETGRTEGQDSLPQITGWIMAECRMRVWHAIEAAGMENCAHIDTDCVLVNAEGLARMKAVYGTQFDYVWQVKARYPSLTIHGPRNYRAGGIRKLAGVPRSAVETAPSEFAGQIWHGLAKDMADGFSGAVTLTDATWRVNAKDPRRMTHAGDPTRTVPIRLPAD